GGGRGGGGRGPGGGGAGAGGRVGVGSSRAQIAWRVDFHPVGRPPRNGELAKAATSTGPIACSRCHRQRKPDQPGPSPPAATQTWTEAVLPIMSPPPGPARAKNRSIAA